MKIKVKIIPDDGPNEVYEFDSIIEASRYLIEKAERELIGEVQEYKLSPVQPKQRGWFKKLFNIK